MNFNYEEYIDVIYYLNEINRNVNKSYPCQFNIHKYVIFSDYPFLERVRCLGWVVNICNLNVFNTLIQDEIMNDKYMSYEKKDIICLELQLFENFPIVLYNIKYIFN
jgi:hypothetical protein